MALTTKMIEAVETLKATYAAEIAATEGVRPTRILMAEWRRCNELLSYLEERAAR